jgi:3-hydroxybutyryl-CoA dehydratase
MAFSSSHLYFDDVEVGQEWESSGRTVTEADVVNFAGVSGDFNPIHMDHEFAKTTPFRRPIAHGLLVFAIASGLGVNCPSMRTVAFVQVREWNFKDPVFIGDTVRLRSRLLEKTVRGRGRRAELVWYRGVVNQDGKIVQEGVLVTLCEGRMTRRSSESVPAAAEALTAEASVTA